MSPGYSQGPLQLTLQASLTTASYSGIFKSIPPHHHPRPPTHTHIPSHLIESPDSQLHPLLLRGIAIEPYEAGHTLWVEPMAGRQKRLHLDSKDLDSNPMPAPFLGQTI